MSGDHAPAAHTTVPVSIRPRSGADAANLAAVDVDSVDRAPGHDRRTVAPSTGRVSLDDGLRARMPVERGEGCRQHALEPRDRAEAPHLFEIHESTRHAVLVLQRDAPLERRDVLGAVEEEEVADLLQVDLCTRPLREVLVRLDAAEPERDVQRIRELGSNTAGRPAGGAGRELRPLEQADVHAGLGQVERDARADHSAAHHDDLGPPRERRRHRRTRLRRKNSRFAGRSASRRMRYGYQSGPYGVATSTLWPRAATSRWSEGRTPKSIWNSYRSRPIPSRATKLSTWEMILSSWVATAMYAPPSQAALHELDVRGVHVALLRVGDLRGLEVRALHDAQVGGERQQPVEVVGSAVEVRLQDRADVLVARSPQALVDPERRVDELGLLHVDAHEEIATRGVRDEALDVRMRGLLVEGEPEVRQLQREVGAEALAGEPVEELGVLAHDDVRPLGDPVSPRRAASCSRAALRR